MNFDVIFVPNDEPISCIEISHFFPATDHLPNDEANFLNVPDAQSDRLLEKSGKFQYS
jgi:hypothetical protein